LALVTLQIDRGTLPHVYANADVTLAPVTPLGDVEIDLSPGGPPAPALAPGALLSSLDGDTRSWLQSLISALGQGTAGRAGDMRALLRTLGPSAEQLRRISAALATRRRDLAELVHELALVTLAATRDGHLGQLVVAGDQTMRALALQAPALRQAITLLPGSLGALDTTLADLRGFSEQLHGALPSLTPAVAGLAPTLTRLRPFTQIAAAALRERINPFVLHAAPVVRTLATATTGLNRATPSLTSSLQVANYFFNELAYNPGGRNQGYLYWMDWFFHNWDSVFSSGDANGISPRADVLANCNILAAGGRAGSLLEGALGLGRLC